MTNCSCQLPTCTLGDNTGCTCAGDMLGDHTTQCPLSNADEITAPDHYTWHPVTEARHIAEEFPYNIGTAIAYLWRHQHKGTPIKDLRKAIQHIEFEVERLGWKREADQ